MLRTCQFDFRIAHARRRGANFVDILGSRSSAPLRFSDLPLRAFEATKLRKNTAFRAIPTRQILMSHICAITSLGWKIFSSNSQYSRKLELLNFLWQLYDTHAKRHWRQLSLAVLKRMWINDCGPVFLSSVVSHFVTNNKCVLKANWVEHVTCVLLFKSLGPKNKFFMAVFGSLYWRFIRSSVTNVVNRQRQKSYNRTGCLRRQAFSKSSNAFGPTPYAKANERHFLRG